MYSYITDELPKALFSSFTQLDQSRVGITGHSMGGHGALTIVCEAEIVAKGEWMPANIEWTIVSEEPRTV